MKTKQIFIAFFALVAFSKTLVGQVNLQNGSPQISYPLFSISDPNNRLSAGVTLNYTGGNGIKVDDMGSSVGTGWDLYTGPSVTRIQHGEPDDQKKGIKNICKYPLHYLDGYLYNIDDANFITNPTIPVSNGATWTPNAPNARLITDPNTQLLVGIPNKMTKEPFTSSIERYKADREIDEFVLNIDGYSIGFFIGRGSPKKVFFINEADNKYKIDVVWDDNLTMTSPQVITTIRGFVVTDNSGIQYYIQNMELSELISYDVVKQFRNSDGIYVDSSTTIDCGSTPVGNNNFDFSISNIVLSGHTPIAPPRTDYGILSGYKTGLFIGNRWLTTKIKNPFTNRELNFEYNSVYISRSGGIVATYSSVKDNSDLNHFTFHQNLISNILQKPSSISSNNEERLEFEYLSSNRLEIEGDKVLKAIKFYKKNQFIEQVDFRTGYFFKNRLADINENFTENDKVYLRIALKGISKRNSISIEQKIADFEYIMSYKNNDPNYYRFRDDDIIPPVFSIYKDHWGYYNGLGGVLRGGDNILLQDNRYPLSLKDSYREQTLQSLVSGNDPDETHVYQVKNLLEFHYTNGTYYEDLMMCANGLIKSINNQLGGKIVFEYEPNKITDWKLDNSQSIDKTVGGVRVKTVTYFDGINTAAMSQVLYEYPKDANGKSSGWGSNWGAVDNAIYSETKDITFFTGSKAPESSVFGYASQLVSSSAGFQSTQTIANNTLRLEFPGLETCVLWVVFTVLNWLDQNSQPQPEWKTQTVTSYHSEAINNSRLIPLMYKSVKVTNIKNNVMAGSTVYDFTSMYDYLPDLVSYKPYPNSQLMLAFKYGLPKAVKVFDNNSKLLKESKYSYIETQSDIAEVGYRFVSQKYSLKSQKIDGDWASNQYPYPSGIYCHYSSDPLLNFRSCIPGLNWSNYYTYPIVTWPEEEGTSTKINYKIYTPYKGKIELTDINETVNGSTTKTDNTTSITYNSKKLIAKKTSLNSKKEIIETEYKYACDYTVSGPIATLNTNNFYTAPVLTETYITKLNGLRYLVGGSITDYEIISNGDVKPSKTYKFRSDKPIEESLLQPFNSNQIVRDPAYYELVSVMKYDNKGGLIETQSETSNNAIVENLNFVGQVIAKVANAKKADIGFTSFESPTDINNIEFDANNLINNTKLAGSYCYQFGENRISKISKNNLGQNVKYKVSFWVYKTGGVPVINLGDRASNGIYTNTITPSRIYQNLTTGWELYEAEVTANAYGIINIINQFGATSNSFNAYFDEVRIYPVDAQMQSVVYNLKGQKIAECDATNRFQFYEYDEKDRPRFIRNEEGSIIKMFEYKIKE